MKILYGLPSEGMGHATRSKVIIQQLLLHHDVRIVTSDKAFHFIQQHFPQRVHRIEGFHLAFKQASISIPATVRLTLRNAPHNLLHNLKQYTAAIHPFQPDIVISDFESFTFFYAKFHRKPLLSLDNMQIINRSQLQISIPPEEKINAHLTKRIIQAKVARASHYLITSFFFPPILKKNTTYIPPIIRDEIIQAIPSTQAHILIYQTSTPQSILLPILQQFPHQPFIVYGYNQAAQEQNVQLKPFSEQQFIQDLASAKAVMANGGFSFLSEAVYLNKPILSIPIPNQFEQFVNASYVHKLGYGLHANAFSVQAIEQFLNQLPHFQQQLATYQQQGNQTTFATLQTVLQSLQENA